MSNRKNNGWSRREFLSTTAVAGTGALLGLPSELIAAERAPETTKLRLTQAPAFARPRNTWPRLSSGPRASTT
jgi:hypothetical protein